MKKYRVKRVFSTSDGSGVIIGRPGMELVAGLDMSQPTANRLEAAGLIKEIKPRKKAAEE